MLSLPFVAPTVLVAVRTALVPPSTASDIEGLDVNFALNITDNVNEAGPSNEREMWGEDPTIECFELTMRFENLHMGTYTHSFANFVVTLSPKVWRLDLFRPSTTMTRVSRACSFSL